MSRATLYNGNLGGLSGADAKCNTAAQAQNLGSSTFKAWLSSSSNLQLAAREAKRDGTWIAIHTVATTF